MRLSVIFIFIFTLYFSEVKLFRYDYKKTIKYLKKRIGEVEYWKNERLLSREVLMGDKLISLNIVLQELNVKTILDYTLKSKRIFWLSNVMINVLSCEYADFSYYFIEYMKKLVDYCLLKKKKLNKIHIDRIQLLPTHIIQMIFTLIDFMNNRTNSEYNTQELLKFLVSWYLQLKNNVFMDVSRFLSDRENNNEQNNQININKFSDTNKIILFQLEKSLNEFIIKNCRRDEQLKILKSQFTEKKKDEIWEAISENFRMYFKGIEPSTLNTQNHDQSNKIVFTNILNNNTQYTTFLNTIENNLNLTVKWNNKELSVREIFENYIKNGTDVQNIMKFELLILDIKIEIFYGRVLEKLNKRIANHEFNPIIFKQCQKDIKVVDKYLNSSKLPVTFVNLAKIYINNLSIIIFGLNSSATFFETKHTINEIISKNRIKYTPEIVWKVYTTSNDGNANSDKNADSLKTKKMFTLSEFLESSYEFIDQTYLNTNIFVLFYESSFINKFGIFDHTFDSAHVTTAWENKSIEDVELNNICKAVKNTMDSAQDAYSNVSVAARNTISTNRIGNFLQDICHVYNALINLKCSLLKMLSATYEHTDFFDETYHLRKLLFTYFYNEENVLLFNQTTYWTEVSLNILLNFHFNFSNQVTMYHSLVCDEPPISVNYNLSNEVNSFLTKNNRDLKNYITSVYKNSPVKCIDGVERNIPSTYPQPPLTDINNENSFDVIKTYGQFITNYFYMFDGPRIRFYWKQTDKTILEIKNQFYSKTFNLQDIVEYQLLTIKWVITSMFSKFLKVLNCLNYHDLKLETIQINCFVQQFKYLSPLFNEKSTLYQRILLIFKSFNDAIHLIENQNILFGLQNVISMQLNWFGVVLKSVPPLVPEDIVKDVESVCSNVIALEKSNFSSLIQSVGLNQILTDIPTIYTKFEEEFFGSTI